MINPVRQEVLQVLAELSEVCPEVRLGQLVRRLRQGGKKPFGGIRPCGLFRPTRLYNLTVGRVMQKPQNNLLGVAKIK